MVWPTLGSRTAKKRNRTVALTLQYQSPSISDPVKTQINCGTVLTHARCPWVSEMCSYRSLRMCSSDVDPNYLHITSYYSILNVRLILWWPKDPFTYVNKDKYCIQNWFYFCGVFAASCRTYELYEYTLCPKKVLIFKLFATSSNLNKFSKFLSSLEIGCEQSFVSSRLSFRFTTRTCLQTRSHRRQDCTKLFSLQYIEGYWKHSWLVASSVHTTDTEKIR